MNATKIVVGHEQANCGPVIFQLLAKSVGQPREPALLHPKRQVRLFDQRRADVAIPSTAYHPALSELRHV